MTTSSERKMMLGSGHKLDYLILKERDGTGLAIKPVYAANSKWGLCICLKIRVARMPSAKSKTVDWKGIWPEIKWVMVDGSRASTVISRYSGFGTHQLADAVANIDDYTTSLVKYLSDVFEGLDHDPADAAEFIKAVVLPVWQAALDAMNQAETKDAGNPEVDLTKVYTYINHPDGGDNTKQYSVMSHAGIAVPDMYAAQKAAYNKFKVIEGGKSETKKSSEEADVQAEDDTDGYTGDDDDSHGDNDPDNE